MDFRSVLPRVWGSLVCVIALVLLVGCGTAASSDSPNSNGLARTSLDGQSPAAPSAVPTLFPARCGSKWGFIDKTGHVVIDFRYEDAWDFRDGMAPVRTGGQWGYIDESGSAVIPPQFGDIWLLLDAFSEGLAPRHNGNSLVGFIDKSGTLLIPAPPEWADAAPFSEGLAPVWLKNGRCGYIDKSGNVVLRPAGVTDVRPFSEGLAAVRHRGQGYGYFDSRGRYVVDPQFLSATEFSDGLAIVEYDFRRFGIIDTSGQIVKRLEYDQVMGLSEGRAVVVVGDGWGYMDESGTLVVPPRFETAWDFAGGLARVEDVNGKMGYIDLDGNYIWREK
jgi:hypothetical protein